MEWEDSKPQHIRIIDLLGIEVLSLNKEYSSNSTASIKVGHLQPGFYHILIDTPDGRVVKQFVKM